MMRAAIRTRAEPAQATTGSAETYVQSTEFTTSKASLMAGSAPRRPARLRPSPCPPDAKLALGSSTVTRGVDVIQTEVAD